MSIKISSSQGHGTISSDMKYSILEKKSCYESESTWILQGSGSKQTSTSQEVPETQYIYETLSQSHISRKSSGKE